MKFLLCGLIGLELFAILFVGLGVVRELYGLATWKPED